jgi:hypothetical protein
MNCLSFKTKFSWIGAFEIKDKMFKVKFGKHRYKSTTKNLKKFKTHGNNSFTTHKS